MSITTVSTGAVSGSAITGVQGKAQDKGTVSLQENTSAQAVDHSTELGEAVARIQDYAQSARRNLDFKVDDSSGRVVVQVINSDSGEVIRQIPSEEVLELASRLEDARSLLLQEKA
ncbi:hypothetical protein DNK06_02800 [Pseudomonas daroniae]|uniref:Flagellar biosynthesis protein FlaG n=1 Tax=Phytopseudomonas daroniae TaxID=2487519 RepID=A0A4V6MX52_9GAMM|nr:MULTISPECIES: flagellar protein FlaG [Pseudomonas]TBU77091.1 hypothetical protein DNK10_06095 [Pseudomonas daroniae]TBU83378.1 hypothetical protein DNK06_02800 [Pseudomonas daroniae]TBU85017.1 hypothetical protein DNK31_05180 [Pseudomonas sp. FRB 228]TBU93690.1 hypothetical protein DNJ99_04890 [Pseudomonas daroniae]